MPGKNAEIEIWIQEDLLDRFYDEMKENNDIKFYDSDIGSVQIVDDHKDIRISIMCKYFNEELKFIGNLDYYQLKAVYESKNESIENEIINEDKELDDLEIYQNAFSQIKEYIEDIYNVESKIYLHYESYPIKYKGFWKCVVNIEDSIFLYTFELDTNFIKEKESFSFGYFTDKNQAKNLFNYLKKTINRI